MSHRYEMRFNDGKFIESMDDSSQRLLDEALHGSSATATGLTARASNRKSRLSGWLWLLHSILGLANILLFAFGIRSTQLSDLQCATQLSAYSPAIPHMGYETTTFTSFMGTSPYKGKPSPELDEAWSELVVAGYVSVPADEFVNRLHKNRTYVSLPQSQGGGFLGNVEVYHQLHCLDLIRQYTYEGYYRQPERMPASFLDSDEILRDHVDHCIDYLRELIMCTGDVGIHTYYWVEGREFPWPDFAVERKCRRWEPIVEFSREAGRDIRLPKKPADAVEYARGG